MSKKFVLSTFVSYQDVDREGALLLSSAFKFFQEAAIQHANQFNIGTHAAVTRGESWVLNRMGATIHRYVRHEEALRVETWSSRVSGCRGYREYRIFVGDELVVSGSSLWLYLNLETKSLVRVPTQIAENFPTVEEAVHEPLLDKFTVLPPEQNCPRYALSLRYSDVDTNGHVNNTAYLDFLQTALSRGGQAVSPRHVRIKFLKEIRPEVETIEVQLEPRGGSTVFAISSGEAACAHGEIE